MTTLVIEFAPLNLPLRRRLQTLAAALWMFVFAFGGLLGSLFTAYLILFTGFRWLAITYLIWIYWDKDTCRRGGRRNEWVRNWHWWHHFRNYFPIRLHRTPWSELDASRNYLLCCFPHGVLPAGIFSALATDQGEFNEYFPHHKPHICTLEQHFHTPFFREIALSCGSCSASSDSLKYLLSKPKGGNAVGLAIGGVAEAYFCKPKQYKLVLKNRKGFVKIALQAGSPLVPVFSFGEVDLFDQLEGSDLKRWQETIRQYIGVAPIVPFGRGFFQYSFGIIPQRKPVNVVVGPPIDVKKIENPTQQEIDELHQKFIEGLVELFETQKHTYIKEADDVHIELV